MSQEPVAKGVQVRRELFGAELGAKHIKEATDFTRRFQDLVTRYLFAEVWGTDTVPRKIRSIITLSMLVAMGKSNEVKVHVRAALTNGVTKNEIREILLHAMMYAGVPAAVDGFRCAREVFAELGVAESD
jgi:4-carboxymuconolactone decarboxylase